MRMLMTRGIQRRTLGWHSSVVQADGQQLLLVLSRFRTWSLKPNRAIAARLEAKRWQQRLSRYTAELSLLLQSKQRETAELS